MRVVSIPSGAWEPVPGRPRYRLSEGSLARWRDVEEQIGIGSAGPSLTPLEPDVLSRTVAATNEIEGEGFGAAVLAAHTDPGERVDAELAERLRGFEDQVEAYRWAAAHPAPLTPDWLMECHRRLFVRLKPDVAGRMRDKRGAIEYHRPPESVRLEVLPPDAVPPALAAVCARFESGARDALAVGEWMLDMLAVHPFVDGNGRVSRMVATAKLLQCGCAFLSRYPIESVILDTRPRFYEALFQSQVDWHTEREDLSPWMDYWIACLHEAWRRSEHLPA